jgi:hypothetical protein
MPEEPFALTLPAPQLAEDDYDAVHAAVVETARGRWFLQEYGRRNRNADTSVLLSAIERIDAALKSQPAIPAPALAAAPQPPQPAAAPFSSHALHELRDAVMLTKESLPAVDPQGRVAFKPDFGRIPTGIATAADRMRASAEQVQETAWFLRERAEQERGALKDALEARCNELEAQARELTMTCAQLDQMSEAASMIAALLAELETRFDEMIAGAPADAAPADTTPAAAPERPTAAIVEPEVAAPAPVPATIDVPIETSLEAFVAIETPVEIPPEETAPAPAAAFVDIPPISTTIAEPPEPAPVVHIDEPPTAEPVRAAPEPVFDIVSEIAAPEPPAPESAVEIPESPAMAELPPAASALAFDIISEIAALRPTVAAAPAPTAPTPQPHAVPAAAKPEWMDTLAPQVRARFTPDSGPPAKINFDFDDMAPTAIALPNPARREMPGSDLVPPPVRPEPVAPRATYEAATVEITDAEIARAKTQAETQAEIADAGVTRADAAPIPLVMRFELPPIAEAAPEAAPEPEPSFAAAPEPELAPEPEPAPAFRTSVLLPDEVPSDDPAAYLFDQMPDVLLPEAELEDSAYSNGSDAHEPDIQPMQPLTPADALAPIMALSDEEKIALFS